MCEYILYFYCCYFVIWIKVWNFGYGKLIYYLVSFWGEGGIDYLGDKSIGEYMGNVRIFLFGGWAVLLYCNFISHIQKYLC
jgi:hypothetical protein